MRPAGVILRFFILRFVIVVAVLALPVAGYAQEATITGSVTDTTGGV